MKKIESLTRKAKKDRDVLALLVFGSYARGERFRDIDICIVLKGKHENGHMSEKRLAYVSESGLDVHIFQQLPLFMRARVLKEGKLVFCRDMDTLYDLASQTAREFAYFKPSYLGYLEAVEHG